MPPARVVVSRLSSKGKRPDVVIPALTKRSVFERLSLHNTNEDLTLNIEEGRMIKALRASVFQCVAPTNSAPQEDVDLAFVVTKKGPTNSLLPTLSREESSQEDQDCLRPNRIQVG